MLRYLKIRIPRKCDAGSTNTLILEVKEDYFYIHKHLKRKNTLIKLTHTREKRKKLRKKT